MTTLEQVRSALESRAGLAGFQPAMRRALDGLRVLGARIAGGVAQAFRSDFEDSKVAGAIRYYRRCEHRNELHQRKRRARRVNGQLRRAR